MYRTPYFQYEHDDEIMSLFTSVISISSDGIYVCDRAGHALLFNESLLTISKIPVDALRDYTVDELVEKDIIPISSAGKTLKTGRQESTVIDYYGGSKAILTSTPVYNKSGEILCIISNVRDITKLNQLEKELSELSHKQSAMNEQQFFQRGGLIYSSKEMEETLELASAFAPNDAPIMILGETGVGKDILAQYIHERSERTGQFVKVNCGAIPEHLLESELFGYVKGAFSGATSDKVGLVELANDGTLFLDEVGDMPHPQQVKLLHVLQDQMVRRIGHTKTTPVNIRVISQRTPTWTR
ncbi:putative sensory histidine kinase YfhA [Geomicrobium sp. JCM 19037]|nr:putative sensory histidine kinase YfhA [Geomicrobium sp. JCM 19037]